MIIPDESVLHGACLGFRRKDPRIAGKIYGFGLLVCNVLCHALSFPTNAAHVHVNLSKLSLTSRRALRAQNLKLMKPLNMC